MYSIYFIQHHPAQAGYRWSRRCRDTKRLEQKRKIERQKVLPLGRRADSERVAEWTLAVVLISSKDSTSMNQQCPNRYMPERAVSVMSLATFHLLL